MTSNTSDQAQGASGTEDDPSQRPYGAVEDGIVSSTADPNQKIESDEALVPPGDAKPAVPPYEGRNESRADGTPGRGEDEMASNKGVSHEGDSAKPSSESRTDEGTGPGHTPGTGRAEHKL